MPKQVEGSTIPPFHEFYRSIHGKEPSGQLWEVYLQSCDRFRHAAAGAAATRLAGGRAGDVARGTPRLNNDKAYAAETLKTMGFVPQFVTGPDINRQVRQALVVTPEIREFVASYMRSANK